MILATGKTKSLTFIEVLFVIIIIGVLIAISLPTFRKTVNNLQLSSASSELQSLMNYLRQRAIIEEKVIYFNIDNNRKECWAQIKDMPAPLKAYSLPKEIKIEAEQNQILFYPDGRIDGITIKLTNLNNEDIILTTKGVYGRVKVQTQE